MASKFDEFATLVVERAESTAPKSGTTYGLNPEFDLAGLTGYDQLAANFVEETPATAEEIINVIAANSEDPSGKAGAQAIFRNLIDNKILIPAKAETEDDTPEGEPAASELEKEPEVKIEDPVAAVAAVTANDDNAGEEKDEGSAVPPPEEDEADTFQQPELKSRVADIIPDEANTDDEDDNDDTPASVLLKREQQKLARMKHQNAKLVNYIFAKRGKSPEEAQKYLERLKEKGLA